MLALAKATAIITSRSTFSLWGAYLSQAPSVWYPKKSIVVKKEVIPGGIESGMEIEWTEELPLPDGFIRTIINRIEHYQKN
jgi:hypothetical protein